MTLHPLRGAGLARLLAVLVITLNVRGAITCVGPLLQVIQSHFGLNGTAAGLLTSLPLFAFGLLSPYAAGTARKFGLERSIFASMLLLVAGICVRYLDNSLALFAGTLMIGAGIAFNNVLLPGLLRRDFPEHVTLVTALFTMVLVICGGLGSGIAVPLADASSWRLSLLSWVLPAALALVVWLPQLRAGGASAGVASSKPARASLWKHPLAWQVSLFMAFQSTAFYVMIAWFPAMMSELAGISAARSGRILFVYQMFVLASVIATPVFIHRFRDQRVIGVSLSSLVLLGYLGLFLDAAHASTWMMFMGVGAGGSLVLAITLFSLRVETAMQSVALSGMAQAVAYGMAAVVPIFIGFMHDVTGRWTLALLLMIVVAALQGAAGLLAGRPVKLMSSGHLH